MKIAIIGAGNVATHLAKALQQQAEICQIVARTATSASRLAGLINRQFASVTQPQACPSEGLSPNQTLCEAITDMSHLRSDMDLYLIAVNDDSVADIVASTQDFPGIWAHTSGSVRMDVFVGKKSNYGVFYPLQTFSRDVEVDISNVPFLIEGSSSVVARQLSDIAENISNTVRLADSQLRESIHVAAVFACNFANLMWVEADSLLRERGIDIRFMLPLLQATLDKLSVKSPIDAMTGPARRGDIDVINKHIASLPEDLKPVYTLLTEKILNLYK